MQVCASRGKAQVARPYEALAEIYDFVMRHVNYDRWALYVADIFKRHGLHPRTVLDLACGTGSLALRLCHLGYEVSGVDGSLPMLRVARRKAHVERADITFWETVLPVVRSPGHFDAVLCLYDSVNYLLSVEEIGELLRNVYEIISPSVNGEDRGLFVFDICTETNSLSNFRDYTECERGRGFSYTRHSVYDPRDRLQTNEFEIRLRSKVSVIEKHTQRIYPLQQIFDTIGSSPFELLGAYGGFTFRNAAPKSERIHFVLR